MKVFISILIAMLILTSCIGTQTVGSSSNRNHELHKNLTPEELKELEDYENPTYY